MNPGSLPSFGRFSGAGLLQGVYLCREPVRYFQGDGIGSGPFLLATFQGDGIGSGPFFLDSSGAGADPFDKMKVTSLFVVAAVFNPIATVKTSMATVTDASMRDNECLRGIGKTPDALYTLLRRCQAVSVPNRYTPTRPSLRQAFA